MGARIDCVPRRIRQPDSTQRCSRAASSSHGRATLPWRHSRISWSTFATAKSRRPVVAFLSYFNIGGVVCCGVNGVVRKRLKQSDPLHAMVSRYRRQPHFRYSIRESTGAFGKYPSVHHTPLGLHGGTIAIGARAVLTQSTRLTEPRGSGCPGATSLRCTPDAYSLKSCGCANISHLTTPLAGVITSGRNEAAIKRAAAPAIPAAVMLLGVAVIANPQQPISRACV